MQKLPFHAIIAGAIALAGLGCGKSEPAANLPEKSGVASATPVKEPVVAKDKVPLKRVTNRPENLKGSVFIAEYHHIRQGKTTMERSSADFRKDLERLYKLGFRPVNLAEYLSGNLDLPPGASPVILTFDDAHPSQIKLLPNGELDPECGLGILKRFSEEHPDFPPKAVFFVLPQMWGQPDQRQKKAEMVKAMGGEIASHTVTHPNLSKLPDEKVKEELAGASKLLAQYGGDAKYLALPLGISPKNKSLLKSFKLGQKEYKTEAVFLVGANPAHPSNSEKFDSHRIPRIQACPGPYGLDFWLDKVEKGQVKPFVTP